MILVIDNYDSFVFNLARYFTRLGCEVQVARNDALDVQAVRELAPQALVISPGPCSPSEAGQSLALVRALRDRVPILGICLGHQAIAAAYGAAVVRADYPRHGRASAIHHTGRGVFAGLPNPLAAGRYHSLVVDESTLPPDLEALAHADDGALMAVADRRRPVVGLQFHPESILTPCGYALLGNFLRLAGLEPRSTPTLGDELRLPMTVPRAQHVPVTY